MTTQIVLSQIKVPNTVSVGAVVTVQSDGTFAANGFALPLVMDDISPQFDGDKTIFTLTLDTTRLSSIINTVANDSKDYDVSINGIVLSPYVTQLTWPWITPYDSFKGFRVVGDNIIFYTAPPNGASCTIIRRNISQTKQTRRYPFTTSSIALGD
jgi:hypothetical protein